MSGRNEWRTVGQEEVSVDANMCVSILLPPSALDEPSHVETNWLIMLQVQPGLERNCVNENMRALSDALGLPYGHAHKVSKDFEAVPGLVKLEVVFFIRRWLESPTLDQNSRALLIRLDSIVAFSMPEIALERLSTPLQRLQGQNNIFSSMSKALWQARPRGP